MIDNPNQAQAGAEAKGGTEAAPAAPADSLNNPGQELKTYEERLQGATTVADIAKLTDDVIEGRLAPPKAAEEKPAGEGTGATEAKPQGEAGEKTAEEKLAEETAQAEAAAAETEKQRLADEAAKATKEAEEKGEEGGDLPNRVRISDLPDVDRLSIQIKKAAAKQGKPITFAEAEKRAMAALGVTPGETKAGDTAPEDNGLPKTAAEVESRLKDLVAQRTKAYEEDLDFKAGNQLTLQIEALRDHRVTLREQAGKAVSAAQAKYDEAFNAAEAKAGDLYDFVKQADSAGFKRMAEIDQQLEANGDPLFHSPDKALKLAQMVAAELAIAPKAPGAKATQAAKVVVAVKAAEVAPKKTVPPVVAASGASRTSTASTQGDALTAKIKGLRTPADLEAFVDSFGKT